MDELSELQKETARLRAVVESMDKSARLLVHRDLELRRANLKLQSLDSQKSEFISIAAHQIRTPLSALRWSQQMLIDGDFGQLAPAQLEIITQAQQSVVRLVTLVNNLLQVERLELQQTNNDLTYFDLHSLLKECVAEFQPLATERKVTLHFNAASSPATIYAHADTIKDIFINLLDNAVKYTLAGGVVTVNVRVGDTVSVSVTDTGIGIPESHQPFLFKRFSRADNARAIDADGSGLGLYIVKKIVEANAGTILCETVEGRGTTFTVTLPRDTPPRS